VLRYNKKIKTLKGETEMTNYRSLADYTEEELENYEQDSDNYEVHNEPQRMFRTTDHKRGSKRVKKSE